MCTYIACNKLMFPLFFIEISETSESLKTKMSELRLYCDLLMQQVHTIQEFVHHDETRSPPSIEVQNSENAIGERNYIIHLKFLLTSYAFFISQIFRTFNRRSIFQCLYVY